VFHKGEGKSIVNSHELGSAILLIVCNKVHLLRFTVNTHGFEFEDMQQNSFFITHNENG
jgi:hypothetical protein